MLPRRLLGKKQLVKRALRKGALAKTPRREGLSAALVELTKAQVRHVALRGVALKLAPARAVVVRLVMLRAALRDGRLLTQAKPVMLSAALVEAAKAQVRHVVLRDAPAKLALVRAVALRAVMGKGALRAPAPLARPGGERLLVSAKIHVSRRKAPPANVALIRLVRVPRARNRRHLNGVVHPPITLRSRRASQWTRHLKPP